MYGAVFQSPNDSKKSGHVRPCSSAPVVMSNQALPGERRLVEVEARRAVGQAGVLDDQHQDRERDEGEQQPASPDAVHTFGQPCAA